MSYQNFKPEVWSKTILKNLRETGVYAPGSHKEFKGQIEKEGDSITFKGLADPTVHTVSFENRNNKIPDPENLEDLSLKMSIQQLRIVNFGIGDVDKAQTSGDMLTMAEESLPAVISDEVEQYISSMAVLADSPKFNSGTPLLIARGASSATQKNPLDLVDDLVEALRDNRVPSAMPLEMIVSTKFYKLLKQEFRELDTDNSGVLHTGTVGKYNNVTIRQSTNIHKTGTNGGTHHLLIRTKRFIGYADAIRELEAYRHPEYFGDYIKGLYLFDAKILRPKQGFFVPVKFS